MSAAAEVAMRFYTGFMRLRCHPNAAADRNRARAVEYDHHRNTCGDIGAPLFKVGTQHGRVVRRDPHGDVIDAQVRGKAERRSSPRLADRFFASEASDERSSTVQVSFDLEPRRQSFAERVKVGRRGSIDIVPKPPDVPISGSTQEQPGCRGTARFVPRYEPSGGIAGEQRLYVETHPLLGVVQRATSR
jgi:hypothetical protein